MKIQEILEKYGFSVDTVIKQIQIEGGKRKYIIKEGDVFYRISEDKKEEIDFVEKIIEEKNPIKKKKATKKKKK